MISPVLEVMRGASPFKISEWMPCRRGTSTFGVLATPDLAADRRLAHLC
jgi:hypothetical protein